MAQKQQIAQEITLNLANLPLATCLLVPAELAIQARQELHDDKATGYQLGVTPDEWMHLFGGGMIVIRISESMFLTVEPTALPLLYIVGGNHE